MTRYRKKPIVIEAMRLTEDNAKDVCDWVHSATKAEVPVHYDEGGNVFVETPEGVMRANVGDFVIRGVKGEFYPCKPDIFDTTYEVCA